jgi:hypothetical protein
MSGVSWGNPNQKKRYRKCAASLIDTIERLPVRDAATRWIDVYCG